MSKSVIAVEGKGSEKIVGGKSRKVVPFVGSDREGEFSQMGIGFMFEDGTESIWGLVMPHMLIKSWRGMKILERLKEIGNATLAACWYAGGREVHDSEKRYLDDLARQFESREEFDAIREEILSMVPSAEELNSMISALREKGVDVGSWELEEEIKEGRIVMSSTIQAVIDDAKLKHEEYKKEQEEIKKPLAREESLSAFFYDLGIANFIIGGGIGGYGMDWGHIKVGELDRIAKQESLSKYFVDGHRLEHTTKDPETYKAELGAGVTMYQTSFGEIEQPYFVAKDGTKYTFVYAKYHDDHFFIRTLVDKAKVLPFAGEFTIAQLRTMLEVKVRKGEIPKEESLPKKKKGIKEKLLGLVGRG